MEQERKWIFSKVLCQWTRKVPLVKIVDNPELAPCVLHGGWVERRWCFLKCEHFHGLYLFEREKVVKPEKIRAMIVKLAKARRASKERDEYLEEVRKHPPTFIADDCMQWRRK